MTLAALPRYILEPLFILLLTFYIIINSRNGNNDSLYLILGTLVFAALKLLPSFQSLYISWAGLNSQKFLIFKLLNFIELQNKTDQKKFSPDTNSTIIEIP